MPIILLRGVAIKPKPNYQIYYIMLPTIKRQNSWLPNIFNDFFNDDWMSIKATSSVPAMNVKEDDKNFFIEMAVPGMTKDDCKVHVNNRDQLVVSVEKKQSTKDEDKNAKFLRHEFSYTKFEQTLLLPENIDREKITAKVCSGVMHVTLPKLEKPFVKEPKQVIEIQ